MCEWLDYALVSGWAGTMTIENRDGRVQAKAGDWIVKHDGGFYVYEPALFHQKYEVAA